MMDAVSNKRIQINWWKLNENMFFLPPPPLHARNFSPDYIMDCLPYALQMIFMDASCEI